MKFDRQLFLFFIFINLQVAAQENSVNYKKDQICSDTKNYLSLEEFEADLDRPEPGYSFFEIDEQQSQLLQSISSPLSSTDLVKQELLSNKNLFYCDDNSEGQGTSNHLVVELRGLNCVVKYVYGFEYGNDEDPLGMFDLWLSPREGFNCKVVGLSKDNDQAVNFELSRFYKTKRLTCNQNSQNVKYFSEVTQPIRSFCGAD